MTISAHRQGCFGSALFYDVNSLECASCREGALCASASLERKGPVMAMVASLDRVFSQEKLPDVEKWFARSHIQNRSKQRSESKSDALLKRWSDDGLNVYHLKHRTNPVETPGVLHDLFKFIVEAGPFKPADAIEHLLASHSQSKVSMTRLVKETCEALLRASVLRKEKHVLCLN